MTGFTIKIKISPNASRNEIIRNDDGSVKIKIMAQPIEGKANKALVEYLSKEFKIPKTSIVIVKGDSSKDKTIMFNITEEEKINLIKSKLN